MNILGIGRDKSQSAYFSGRDQVLEYETEKGQGPATPPGRAARLGLRQGVVWWLPAPPRPLLPPIYCPQDENPKGPIKKSTKESVAAVISIPRSGGI